MKIQVASALVSLFALTAAGCGAANGPRAGSGALSPSDPTPQSKCKVALSQESPLVTEWPASEKARLESLAARQLVAVQYSGCEMRIVDGCQLSGNYAWRATTLSTDTVEISDADELYAKLPLGAVGLEGQLERSGRLAVRTTVAGHLEAAAVPAQLPPTPACSTVTHVVKGISVGAFRLVSGGSVSAGGGAGALGVGAGAASRSAESVMREAGDPALCVESTEASPHPQCASPIQVFLVPTGARAAPATAAAPGAVSDEQRARELGGNNVSFPARDDEHWLLRDGSRVLCELPCTRWIPPASGYHLERQGDGAKVELPDRLGGAPGSSVSAEYHPERGSPLLAALAFYGVGVPCAIGGTVLLILAASDTEKDATGDSRTGFYVGSSAMFLSFTLGTAAWYFLFSDWEHFETRSARQAPGAAPPAPRILVGPGGVGGYF